MKNCRLNIWTLALLGCIGMSITLSARAERDSGGGGALQAVIDNIKDQLNTFDLAELTKEAKAMKVWIWTKEHPLSTGEIHVQKSDIDHLNQDISNLFEAHLPDYAGAAVKIQSQDWAILNGEFLEGLLKNEKKIICDGCYFAA